VEIAAQPEDFFGCGQVNDEFFGGYLEARHVASLTSEARVTGVSANKK
jgi:hypothetical protein